MVERAARAEWERDRLVEGRMAWDELEGYAKDRVLIRVADMLEAALPQDADLLRRFARECEKVAEIL